MCGIFGITSKSGASYIDKSKVCDSALLMRHRGPDAYGQWGIPQKVELAHLRLSIIDLSHASDQPFFSNCKKYVIVFNGEIYNYVEIREELKSLGHQFRTSSDTEVLLNSYIEWGDKCVSRFNGDWAFAIYDIQRDALFCSRDRFGVKPFNYATVGEQFVFSSEVKSILNYFPQLLQPNYNVISNFCRNGLGAQSEATWFSCINRLLPAHSLTLENGSVRIAKYWEYPQNTIPNITLNEAVPIYRELFINAVKLRMRSDVPVGTTLSSGLDSGSIVSVLRRFYAGTHKTFTAIFDHRDFERHEKAPYRGELKVDESRLVSRLAEVLNLESHLIQINKNHFVGDLSDALYYLESGHSSPAVIPLLQVLDFARKHVTVIMEGQGADELLSGYIVHTFPWLVLEHLKRGNIRKLETEFRRFRENYSLNYSLRMFFRLLNSDFIERCHAFATGISKAFGPKLKDYTRIKDFPLDPPPFNERFNTELFKSHSGGLVNLLHYGDAISMSRSIESRNPFTDVNLVEFSFRLPFYLKASDGFGKYIHRVAMDQILPDFILRNPIKFGFNTPLSMYFASYEGEGNKILLSEACLERGIFYRDGLRNLIERHIDLKMNNSTLLFRMLSVELWFRVFFDEMVHPKFTTQPPQSFVYSAVATGS